MATQTKPEPGTEVQLAGSAMIGKLPPEYQQALELRKMRNQVAAQIAATNWGKGLDLATVRGIADWGQQFRVDVTTEIHILGGNIYLNASFYLRQLAEMIAAGLVEYAFADHVEHDPRLAKLGAEGEGEITRRLRERLLRQIPDEAKSAVVFRVKLRSMEKEIVGVKWCGGGTRKNDPVGEQFPVETSETRAARKAMRLLTSHVPPTKAAEIEHIEQTSELLSARIDHARQEVRAQNEAIAARHPKQLMSAPREPGSYEYDASGGEQVRDVPAEPAPPRTAAQRATVQRNAEMADPYTVATPDQKARITALLNDQDVDVNDAERTRIAQAAGKRDYSADDAAREIARLEQLRSATDGDGAGLGL